jgi:hypothetical protein
VTPTDLICACGAEVVVTYGVETPMMLCCSGCGDYLYQANGTRCIGAGTIEATDEEIFKFLGENALLPEILEYIKNLRKRLGLDP